MDTEYVEHLHSTVSLSCFKKNDLMKFPGKMMELEKKIVLSDVTQNLKDKHCLYSFTNVC